MTELMIALTIGAIFLTLAVPSYTNLISRNKVIQTKNAIVSGVSYARERAVQSGRFVSFCRSNAAGTSCVATATEDDGYLVYYSDSNGALSSTTDILHFYPYNEQVQVFTSNNPLVFSSSGFISNQASTTSFIIGYPGCTNKANGRFLQVSISGSTWLINNDNKFCP